MGKKFVIKYLPIFIYRLQNYTTASINSFSSSAGSFPLTSLYYGRIVAITCPLDVAGRCAIYFPSKSGCFSICFIDSVIFFYLFPILSHVFRYFFYHLLLRPGTGRFFGNRRCDFQQSNVSMLAFCFFASI